MNAMFARQTHEKTTKSHYPLSKIIPQVIKRFGNSKKLIPPDFVLLAIDGCMQAAVPAAIGYVIDRLTVDPHRFVKQELPLAAILVVVGSIIFYLVACTQHYINQVVSRTLGVNFQCELYSHLQTLSSNFYQRTHVGEISSRLTKDISQGVEPLWPQFVMFFWSLCVLIPSCISMALISFKLFVLFAIVLVFFGIFSRLIIPRVRKMNLEVQNEAGKINARITEDIAANQLIRAFAQEETFNEALTQHTSVFLSKALKSARLTVLYGDFMNTFLSIFAPLALILGGAYFVIHGTTIGALVALFGYWKAASGPVSFILTNITQIFTSLASVDRILEFFDEQPQVQDVPKASKLVISKGVVSFKNVTFCYPVKDSQPVITNMNLDIPQKSSLAIVGESGAGKTTIIQLIMRFFDPVEGNILIDNQDIRTVTQKSLRQEIGLVMQETILLSGTIRQNMQFAKPEASEQEIIDALSKAKALDFVMATKDGLDTVLGERGARLSGGQKQRLSIARVFLKNPPIVIFDEATSALDTITEKQIQDAMKPLMEGRTSIIIAHRLSTVIGCDRIIILDKGVISETGTHEELFDKSEQYRLMCLKQHISVSPLQQQ